MSWFWFGVALVTGLGVYLAGKKNRDQFGWGLLCFLFGLVPLVILLFLKPLPPNE